MKKILILPQNSQYLEEHQLTKHMQKLKHNHQQQKQKQNKNPANYFMLFTH